MALILLPYLIINNLFNNFMYYNVFVMFWLVSLHSD